MNSLLEIGEFQFENLVRNRIPFVLLNLGADLKNLYPSFLQEQLERQMVMTNTGDAIGTVQERKLPQDTAIVVVCQNGLESPQIAETLNKLGFGNVYFLKDGARSLRPDQTN